MSITSNISITGRRGVDTPALICFLLLITVGWFSLLSVASDGRTISELINLNTIIGTQTVWLGIGLLTFLACFTIDWKFWSSFSYLVFGVSLFLLLMVLIVGVEIKGSKSWFNLFGFSFQPSEFAKLGTALAVASFVSSPQINISNTKHFLLSIGLIMMPVFLIMLQPDAGSAMVFLSLFMVLYIAGANRGYYFIVITLFANIICSLTFGTAPVLLWILVGCIGILLFNIKNEMFWTIAYLLLILATFVFSRFGYSTYTTILLLLIFVGIGSWSFLLKKWRTLALSSILLVISTLISFGTNWAFLNLLKPHQQDRINVWLRPDLCDPRGSLYNIIQSKIAIGSGGFWGTGFMDGAMTKLDFVPEQTTDFIFCTIGEEQGFLGVCGVLFLFGVLMVRMVIMAERARINFIRYYIYGVLSILFFHFTVNIGMTMGLMPVVGIPLPFMSKGGSSLLVFFILFGIMFKMDMARQR